MSQRFNQYVDEFQNVHIQDEVLGQGGQGVVSKIQTKNAVSGNHV